MTMWAEWLEVRRHDSREAGVGGQGEDTTTQEGGPIPCGRAREGIQRPCLILLRDHSTNCLCHEAFDGTALLFSNTS
jgi:hypothetical protein